MEINKLGLNPSVLLTFDKHEEHVDFSDNKKYIYLQGRALSASLLQGQFYIDFSKDDVLKKSVEKLVNKPVFANHEKDVSKWVGKVTFAEWDDSNDPNGINFRIKMPSLDNPNATEYSKSVAKGIMEEVINSFSVGVHTKMSMSHPDMEVQEFLLKQGQEVDGEVVRLIVDEVLDFIELSVVYDGRDPNAKLTNMYLNNSFTDENKITKEDLLNMVAKVKNGADSATVDNEISDENKEVSSENDDSGVTSNNEDKNTEQNNLEGDQQNMDPKEMEAKNLQSEISSNLSKQDQLQKQMMDMMKQMSEMKGEIDKYQKANLNLKQQLEEEKLSKQNVSKNLKEQDYKYFKEKSMDEGLIFSNQLLVDDEGNELLEQLYLSLNEQQLLLFKRFVQASPVKTLLEMSKKSTAEESEDENNIVASKLNRSEFIGRKIADYAKNNSLSTKNIYSNDTLYNKLYNQFEREYNQSVVNA